MQISQIINTISKFIPGRLFNSPSTPEQPQEKIETFNEAYINYRNRTGDPSAGGAKYIGGISGDGSTLNIDHLRTRQNARVAYHQVPQAKAIVDRYADTVVDIGLKLESTPMYRQLGITQEQAEKWAQDVSEKFHLWANSKKSHRAQTNNFYQNQRLYAIQQQRDNDQFVRFHYSNSKKLLNPLQIDFLDPNQIRGDSITSTFYQYAFDDGIIRNNAGVETGYKVWTIEKMEYKKTEVPAIGAKSGRRLMVHGFNAEYSGQKRGYSRLSHALQDFQKITDFSIANIQKAIMQASMVMATENDQADPSNPMEGVTTNSAAGPIVVTEGETTTITEDEALYNFCDIPEAAFLKPGVGVFNMTKGDKLKLLEPHATTESYESFVNAFTSYLSSSMSMPIEILLMKFSSNYSASRAAIVMFWRIAMIWRMEMEIDFLNPVYESWLSEEIAAGRISAPGWNSPILREAWLYSRWIGVPMPQIDPLKEVKATKEAMGAGLTTQERESRNYNGSEASSNRIKLAKEMPETPVPPWDQKQGG